MVKGFPFEVPKEYSNLPQLKVRWICGLGLWVGVVGWRRDPL